MSSSLSETRERIFDDELAARAAALRSARLLKLGAKALLWLAVAPSWTRRLAQQCKFPTGRQSIDDFVAAAEAANVCVTVRSAQPDMAKRQELSVLSTLALHLPARRLRRALELAAVSDGPIRAKALVNLAPALADADFSSAVSAAQAIAEPGDRGTAVLALAEHAPPASRGSLLAGALEAASLTDRIDTRARLMLGLCRVTPTGELSAELVREAIAAALALPSAERRTAALADLGPVIPAADRPQILRSLEEIANPGMRAGLAATVASLFPRARKRALLDTAVAWARSGRERSERNAALLAVVAALADDGDAAAASDAADAIEADDARALALGMVAASAIQAGNAELGQEMIDRALLALATTVDDATAVTVIAGMAEMLLSAGAYERAVDLARTAQERARTLKVTKGVVHPLGTLSSVMARLNDRSAAEALADVARTAAGDIGDPRERYREIVALLPLLAAESRSSALADALASIRIFTDPVERAAALTLVLPDFDDRQRKRLIDECIAIAREQEELSFWMPQGLRAEVVALLAASDETVDVHAIAGSVAGRILEARDSGVPVPPPVVRWATLARHVTTREGVADAAAALDSRVSDAMNVHDLAGALEWVDTGATLADAVGDALAGTVRYARRRIELFTRTRGGDRPESFLERAEQIHAFRELLDDPGAAWALHYVGVGGVGKSALIAHLTRRATEFEIATGKVDFDYLSPDYPTRRPAQLLLELMAELQLYAHSERLESLVKSFRDRVVRLHESTVARPGTAAGSDPQFDSVLRSFCDFVQLLDMPVVLFLDTCEELARYQPEGARLPNVEATFDVIERIHDAVPRVRVVFAGRRLLASEGRDWSVDRTQALQPITRRYLRLHEVRGFTQAEARRFLTDIKKLEDNDLIDAILRSSIDLGSVADIRRPGQPPGVAGRRHNPFDLTMYAEWVENESSVTPAMISSGTLDPYVDRRIVGRISAPDVRALLPAVALLQRFDADLLRPAFEGGDDEFARAFEELGKQEWISAARSNGASAVVLQVDPNLHPRLRAYYAQEDREPYLTRAKRRLSPGLSRRLENTDLGELTPQLVDDTMGVLEEAAAAALWHRLTLRAADEGRWDWIRHVAGRLLSEEGSVRRRTHPARAGVRAAFVSLVLHDGLELDLTDHWREVHERASREPDPGAAAWLRARACAGLVAASAEDGASKAAFERLVRAFPGQRVAAFLESHPAAVEQLAGSCCAALHALAERGWPADGAAPSGDEVAGWAGRLEQLGVSAAPRAFAHVLAARRLAVDERWGEAAAHADDAERCAAAACAAPDQRWLDWVAPASLRDRVRLEALRLGAQVIRRNDPRLGCWADEARGRIGSIDAERLVSAILEIRLAHGLAEPTTLDDLAAADVYDPGRRPQCAVHTAVRPLIVNIALGWLACGDAESALQVLNARLAAATRSGLDPLTVQAAEAGKLLVFRRMRLERDVAMVNQAARSEHPETREAAWAVIALTRPARETSEESGWRYQTALAPGGRQRLEELGRRTWETPTATATPIESALDRVEWRLLIRRPGGDGSTTGNLAVAAAPDGDRVMRNLLRAATLDAISEHHARAGPALADLFARPPQDWVEQVGLRRMAELALEEGELLGLRLPAAAYALLQLSGRWFHLAGDPVGALLATARAAIAAAHADRRHPDRDRLGQDLERAFERVAKSGALRDIAARTDRPPTWPGLVEDRRADLSGSSWAGWLERLRLVAGWCSESHEDRPAHIDEPAVSGPLPVELMLDPMASGEPEARPVNSLMVYGAIGLAFLVGGYLLTALGVRSAAHAASVEVSLLGASAIVAALIGAVWLIVASLDKLGKSMRVLAMGSSALRLTLSARGGDPDAEPWPEGTPVGVRLDRREVGFGGRISRMRAAVLLVDLYVALVKSRRPSALRLGELTVIEGHWSIPRLSPYGEGVAGFPATLAAEVRAVRAGARRATVPIALEVAADVAGVPWEAFVAAATAPFEDSAGDVLPYRRAAALPGAERRAFARDRAVRIVASRTWRPLAAAGWHAWGIDAIAPGLSDSGDGEHVTVMHLIGHPASSSRGYILQVTEGAGLSQAVEASVRSTGIMLEPDRLGLGPSSLVVVQAEPFEIGSRVDTDREEAAKLRLLASALSEAGAWAVLTMPALPPALAVDVLRRLAAGLRPRPWIHPRRWLQETRSVPFRRSGLGTDPAEERLFRAFTRARRSVATWPGRAPSPGLDPESYTELAQDMCLFVHKALAELDDELVDGRR